MIQHTRDLRIRRFRPLLPPAILLEELPLSEAGANTVTRGRAEIVRILRGGQSGPNYDAAHVQKVSESLRGAGLPARVMVDCSHGNSSKDYRRQPVVAHTLAEQIAAGEAAIFGIMMESFLVDGRQDLKPGAELRYGQSITDACLGWDATVPVLHELAEAVRARRAARGSKSAAS